MHPTLLDTLIRTGLIAGTGGSLHKLSLQVPRRVGYAWITLLDHDSGVGSIQAASNVIGIGSNKVDASYVDSQGKISLHASKIWSW